ncbi:MAG: carboxypeptidase-like regulatory domain-containing protein [Bacteroidales bacterium]
MKRIFLFTVIVSMLFSVNLLAGDDGNTKANKKSATIHGKVLDHESGENLVGAVIKIEGTDIKEYSNLNGDFNINEVEPGSYNLVISYISYSNSYIENLEVNVGEDKQLKVHLKSKDN